MKLLLKQGTTSQTVHVFVNDSASTTGGGKTGIAYNASGFTAYYICETQSSSTSISLASATVGTWTSGGWKEIDSANMPGWYEFGVPNACLATGKYVNIHFQGAAGMVPVPVEIQLSQIDVNDGIRAGMTALPNVASGSAGAIPTTGTGANQISVDGSGKLYLSGTQSFNTTGSITGNLSGSVGSVTSAVTLSTGTGAGQILLTSGAVTVGSVTGTPSVNVTQIAGQTVTVNGSSNVVFPSGSVLASQTGTTAPQTEPLQFVAANSTGIQVWPSICQNTGFANTGITYTTSSLAGTFYTSSGSHTATFVNIASPYGGWVNPGGEYNVGIVHLGNGVYLLNFSDLLWSGITDRMIMFELTTSGSPPLKIPFQIQPPSATINLGTNAPTGWLVPGSFSGVFPTNFSSMGILGTGQVGVNWGNVANASSTVNLSATTVNLVNTTTTVTGGATASSQTTILNAVNAITTNTARSAPRAPTWMVIPSSGSAAYVVEIYLYTLQGIPEAPDSGITIHARDASGTSLDGHLSSTSMTMVSSNHYRVTYTVQSTDPNGGQVYWDFTWSVASVAMNDGATSTTADADSLTTMAAIKAKTDLIATNAGDSPNAVTAQNTLATGYVGIDWSKVSNASSTVNLSNTSINTVTSAVTVGNVTLAASQPLYAPATTAQASQILNVVQSGGQN